MLESYLKTPNASTQLWSILSVGLLHAVLRRRSHEFVLDRHFLAHERFNDATQRIINQSHRFESFAAQRRKCTVKWYVRATAPCPSIVDPVQTYKC